MCLDSHLFSLFPVWWIWPVLPFFLQRASPLKPLPSSIMLGAPPESCPSRRAPPCCCISGRQKTGGRDATTVSMVWCHTNILWFKMCKFVNLLLNSIAYYFRSDWTMGKVGPVSSKLMSAWLKVWWDIFIPTEQESMYNKRSTAILGELFSVFFFKFRQRSSLCVKIRSPWRNKSSTVWSFKQNSFQERKFSISL